MKNFDTPFPYYVGVQSLHELANKHSRVCIMNIRGSESKTVTPISHAFSGGNVVAGVQYGESGSAFETPVGDIPVFGGVDDVIKAGLYFDTGVIYLPPTAVCHAASEMCARNPMLQRIVIVTEKISVRDSRLMRYGCQNRRIDIIGANSLGVANSWDQVRIGGALGGDDPASTLVKGSVAIHSNSGNFCTTIAAYLKTAGFGTSTIVSSGKDVYIHFALAEFLYCAENDPRTKAIAVYVEPGGYYEKQALDWIEQERFMLTKPIIACVTGRWKSNLTRSCGHAGAIVGSGDDAAAKEAWFDSYFGVPVFNAENPLVSPRGVRIASIQDAPAAVAAVMAARGEQPDFQPAGDLSLKPWFVNDQGLSLPSNLKLNSVKAVAPFGEQIEEANRFVGARIVRETMCDRSGATSVAKDDHAVYLHGWKLLDLIDQPFGATNIFSLLKTMPDEREMPLINAILNWFVAQGGSDSNLATVSLGRESGCTPNAAIGAAVLLAGNNGLFQELRDVSSWLIDLFYNDVENHLDIDDVLIMKLCGAAPPPPATNVSEPSEKFTRMFEEILVTHGLETVFTRFAKAYCAGNGTNNAAVDPFKLLLSSMLLGLAWKSLAGRRITRETAQDVGVYLALNGIIVGTSSVRPEANSFLNKLKAGPDLELYVTDFAVTCFQLLFNRAPFGHERYTFNALLNLTVTNGPGALSIKGAKESVSARNHVSTAYAGFLTNTGLAHGGNGFEAVNFLLNSFAGVDPYRLQTGNDAAELQRLAVQAVGAFTARKRKTRNSGAVERIPCVNHPVFNDKKENHDPRETRLRGLLAGKGISNPFLEFYHFLVKELHAQKLSPKIYCVNVDAAIACIALDLLWKQLHCGELSEKEAQDIVFTMFLHGRMVGVAAEIIDHSSKGLDLDCRTPPGELAFLR